MTPNSSVTIPQKHWWHGLVTAITSSAPGSWLAAKIAPPLDRWIFRLSNGRTTLSSIVAGVPVILVTTTGAKSGQPRTIPLLGIPDGENIILIASNWGGKKHPAWYYNLKANPVVQVTGGGQDGTYTAEEVGVGGRERCWQRALAYYPGYNAYERRANGRIIPIIWLTPSNA